MDATIVSRLLKKNINNNLINRCFHTIKIEDEYFML